MELRDAIRHRRMVRTFDDLVYYGSWGGKQQ